MTFLRSGEQSVNDIADALDMRQPQTSKHLRVLSEVDLVHVRQDGRQRLYSLQAEKLKPIFTWLLPFEQLWTERFDQLDEYLKKLQQEETKHEQ